MRKFLLLLVFFALIATVGKACIVAYEYIKAKNDLQFTPIESPNGNASSTEALSATSTERVIENEKLLVTNSWKKYSNEELGYSLKYPENLIFNYGNFRLILAFPKKDYFKWPLEDSVTLKVVASSTCATLENVGLASSSEIVVGEKRLTEVVGSDVAAGNVYKQTIYSINGNGACYSLIVDSRGANGAGLFVDDPALVKKYNEEHALKVEALQNVIYTILSTFEVIKTPDGVIEGR